MAFLNSYIIALLLSLTFAVASNSITSYSAAVVEYHPLSGNGDNASDIFYSNVAEYGRIIELAKSQGADIVVFPEYGLTGLHASSNRKIATQFAQTVPLPPTPHGTAQTPCLSPNASEAVRRLSCAALQYKIYVVVNLLEMESCSQNDQDCPEDGFYIYNANVAFDRDGAVISKYHKYNLFLEHSINKPKKPMYSTFTTDFGVTFGMFICFDILFEEPALHLVKHMNVKDMVYSTAWISQLPFLTAVQTQESWSFGMDVNLLASGFNNPVAGNGGSGIYVGRKGSLISKMPLTAGTNILMAQVPLVSSNGQKQNGNTVPLSNNELPAKINNEVRTSHMSLLHDDLSNYTFSEILRNGLNDIELCYGNLCCNFHADVQFSDGSHEDPRYRFVITNSQIKYSNTYPADIQVCALIYCKGNDTMKCVYYPDDPQMLDYAIFHSIKISGNFTSPRMLMPSTLTTNLEPLQTSSLNFMANDGEIKLESNIGCHGILTFSLYVRQLDALQTREESIYKYTGNDLH